MDVDTSYSELGLTAQSTDAEIKTAWRRLAARWHPDRNNSPAALRKIQRINQALEQIRASRRGPLETGVEDAGRDSDEGWRTATGSGGDESAGRPERILNHTVRLSLEEAVAGCIRDLHGEVVDECEECGATGFQAQAAECPACAGTGQLRQPLWFLWAAPVVECRRCQGHGVIRQACGACAGSGHARSRKYRCRVSIPAGARDGAVLHFPARAAARTSRFNEILSVRVELQPHEFFELEADGTVRCEIPVDGFAWIANRWIEVPTPAGLQQMKLKRGHLGYRIKGQGMPSEPSGPRADCIVTVVPLFPDEFSNKQQAQIDRLIATNTEDSQSAAGKRAAAWNQRLQCWQAGLPRTTPRG